MILSSSSPAKLLNLNQFLPSPTLLVTLCIRPHNPTDMNIEVCTTHCLERMSSNSAQAQFITARIYESTLF